MIQNRKYTVTDTKPQIYVTTLITIRIFRFDKTTNFISSSNVPKNNDTKQQYDDCIVYILTYVFAWHIKIEE